MTIPCPESEADPTKNLSKQLGEPGDDDLKELVYRYALTFKDGKIYTLRRPLRFLNNTYVMKKKQNPKKEVHQLILGKQRTQQVEQGYFEGRFVQRTEPSKKIYRRAKNKRWGKE